MDVLQINEFIRSNRKKNLIDYILPNSSYKAFAKETSKICDDFYFDSFEILGINNFIECGANNAEATRYLASKGVSAIAIEANPITFKNLTSKNSDSYTAINIGLGASSSCMDFFIPIDDQVAGSATFSPVEAREYSKISVPVTTVDSVVFKNSFLNEYLALWIDVEGFQRSVLNGAVDTLNNPKCLLIKIEVEMKDIFKSGFLANDVDAFLRKAGFECIVCDLMSNAQTNCFYVKKSHKQRLKLKQCFKDLKYKKCSNTKIFFHLVFPILSFIKRMLLSVLGDKLGNQVAAFLGSKESKLRHK